jgi:hypothetical protein
MEISQMSNILVKDLIVASEIKSLNKGEQASIIGGAITQCTATATCTVDGKCELISVRCS